MAQLANSVIEKIARMAVYDVPADQICAVTGLADKQLRAVYETDEFKEWTAKLAGDSFNQQQMLADGWNTVEELGMQRVIEYMNVDPDPEFALRAAVMANKANRRGGGYRNAPIQGDLGTRAVVHLQATFVENLQQNFQLPADGKRAPLQLEKKESNFMSARRVQDMLTAPEQDEIEADLANFEMMPAPA